MATATGAPSRRDSNQRRLIISFNGEVSRLDKDEETSRSVDLNQCGPAIVT